MRKLGCVLLVSSGAAFCGCGSDETDASPGCVGAQCGSAGSPGDAALQETSTQEAAPQVCAPLADITSYIGGALFFGYSALGTSAVKASCGELGDKKEFALSLTPDFTGELVLSTQHPTTKLDTVIELREQSCEGKSIGCAATATEGAHGSRLTVPVTAGTRYVALVETSDDAEGIFALGVHSPGVCEGQGSSQEVSARLLTGERFDTDTSSSTSSLRGSCGGAGDAPEARISFKAPRSGTMVATTLHPKTTFEALLHVRESYCDSPEAERGCQASGGLLRFEAFGDRVYDLFVDGADASAKGQATVTLGYAAQSPATAALQGCSHASIQDQFALVVPSGQSVSVKVDTADAATAADTRLRIRLPDGTELYEADDEVACTFAPPKYQCPEHSFTANTAGLYTLEVYVGTSESCADKSLVNYVLTATVDGKASELISIKDQ